ncbi:MAG: NAD(P)-dependent glycerol-3-phosphate dehydrogenase [Gammaproteobacteria bacterium]|nr:NAD(P)-dependent glycerol-3-phosphate dehydrogenase [Gammaproteobacteria bacterium]MCY4166004.1 NAD(P)-dependent glycerol-3-phosphate dehydrogenase [Gammaproteobacteria bacterium]MCY4256380.1 NAD(P)-dependent glycerol-3-phosphate dehydrogenase [Gammaproteobacteria bacterium]MCY4341210.1 NAD(P)-dependent glycerol-3-phosphate dehydrogenase [Gammaproteobacteria bacterium]
MFAVIGAGAWGTALAVHLAKAGCAARIWDIDGAHLHKLANDRENRRYLPGVPLPGAVKPTGELEAVTAKAECVLVVTPSSALRKTFRRLKPLLTAGTRIGCASKGLEVETGLLAHQVAEQELGPDYPLAAVSGPTFAAEVAVGRPAAITVASRQRDQALWLARKLNAGALRAYVSEDLVGVEVGGATKNVIAIAAGASDGLGYGANARAALICRGLAEIVRLGLSLGAEAGSFMGLAGLGDLALTCSDDQSRNRRLGLAVARGTPVNEALRELGQVAEGFHAAEAIHKLSRRLNLDLPISEQVYRVLYRGQDPGRVLEALLSRPLKAEDEAAA